MKICMIGAGRVAHHLAPALLACGHTFTQVMSRTPQSAAALARQLGAEPVTSAYHVSADADLYLLSLTDSAVAPVAHELIKALPDKFFVHTAGSLPLSLLSGALRSGVLYPMQTFTKEVAVDFGSVPFFVEGSDDVATTVLRQLASELSPRVFTLSSEGRRKLHLSAVFACNFANHCYALADELLQSEGLPFDVMLPLIDATARKAHEIAPSAAQTGPAARRDYNVIEAQSSLLAQWPLYKEVYDVLTRSIIHLDNTHQQL